MADQEENNSATTQETPAPTEETEQTQDGEKAQSPVKTPEAAGQTTEGADTNDVEAAEGNAAASGEPQPEKTPEVEEGEGQSQEAPEGEQVTNGEGQEEVKADDEATTEGGEGESQEAPPKAEGEGETPAPEGEQATPAPDGEGTTDGEAAEGEKGATEGEGEQKEGEEEQKEGEEEKTEGETEGETEVSKSPVPQSDTFATGERAESPMGVGEKLSREGSPVTDILIPVPNILEPGTPNRSPQTSEAGDVTHMTTFEEEEEDDDDDEEDEQPEFDREELIQRYHQAIMEREQQQQNNYQLQHKLAEYFRKKKADETRQEYDKNVTDQEQRYLKYMAQLEDLRRQDMQERDNYKHVIQDLKSRCEDRKERVDNERQRFIDFKKQVALNSLNSRSGRSIPPKDIESYLTSENRKEAEVVNVRLENIKLKNKLKKKDLQLKSKEELAEGLHLIDFEQLKIENQTYNEKIEERNEELLKLRKKITSTVQVLTHLKEKLQYVQAENQVQKRNLRDVEVVVAQKRDILSRTKQARDALRIDNQRLRQNCGLLGNEPLLRDFEERKDEGDDLRDKLERLKMQHAELTLNCNQVRRKIEQARNGRA